MHLLVSCYLLTALGITLTRPGRPWQNQSNDALSRTKGKINNLLQWRFHIDFYLQNTTEKMVYLRI